MYLLRNRTIRVWVALLLAAILIAGFFVVTGSSPALLPAVFFFLVCLVVIGRAIFPPTAAKFANFAKERTPARAPPIFSF